MAVYTLFNTTQNKRGEMSLSKKRNRERKIKKQSYRYICPRCGNWGYPSVYGNTCTACANHLRFGAFDPLPYLQEISAFEKTDFLVKIWIQLADIAVQVQDLLLKASKKLI